MFVGTTAGSSGDVPCLEMRVLADTRREHDKHAETTRQTLGFQMKKGARTANQKGVLISASLSRLDSGAGIRHVCGGDGSQEEGLSGSNG